ncbi:MAG: prepilin-type N-terminal cleavage/methylation domain-containing protein [Planctomycetaceae bacterium]|nr:prepilin-type N-terminal cleavage/methylation domain-containing protein [Planctomycetaceae bacterium]
MKYINNKNYGFTLAETLAALVIAMMIMAAAVAVYSTVRKAQFSIDRRLKEGFTATEIIQRISEDIDRLALPSSDVTMSIKNKLDIEGFRISQMIIESKYYDKDNQPQTFEKIIWQSRVAADGNQLIIYRAHSGYSMEDKMLEEGKEKYQREMYIPVCSGVTMFAIEVTDGNSDPNIVTTSAAADWTNAELPQAVKISISFEPRWQDALGNMTVSEESVKTRIVAVNRFRQIPYTFVYKEFGDANEIGDINDINDVNLPNDINDVNSLTDTSTKRT